MFHIIKYMCFTAKTYISVRSSICLLQIILDSKTGIKLPFILLNIRNCRSQQLENTETDTFAYVQKQHQPISFILSFLNS